MIYHKNLLIVKVLFESFRRKPISGIYRPQAYITDAGGYCTTIRFELFEKEITYGEQVVLRAVIECPVGYGKHLRAGALLVLKEGIDEIGKAVVLEIRKHDPNELEQPQP